GYRDVLDPSLHLIVESADDPELALLVWTTTPWTLVSNVALAINPDLDYVEVAWEGRRLILAADRVAAVLGADAEENIVRRVRGSELVGMRYRRPFDWVDG